MFWRKLEKVENKDVCWVKFVSWKRELEKRKSQFWCHQHSSRAIMMFGRRVEILSFQLNNKKQKNWLIAYKICLEGLSNRHSQKRELKKKNLWSIWQYSKKKYLHQNRNFKMFTFYLNSILVHTILPYITLLRQNRVSSKLKIIYVIIGIYIQIYKYWLDK